MKTNKVDLFFEKNFAKTTTTTLKQAYKSANNESTENMNEKKRERLNRPTLLK